MVIHGSRSVFMALKVPGCFYMVPGLFLWFLLVFHDSRLVFHDNRWNFMVIYGFRLFYGYSWFHVGVS